MRVRYIVLISLVFFASVIGIWFLNYRGHLYPAALGAPDGPGTFGDSFGSINALFAGLAFAGIAVSIFIQADQLRVSRKEMIAAQDTLEATASNLEKQNTASYKQTFEATFFQLLTLFNDIPSNFIVKSQIQKETLINVKGYAAGFATETIEKEGRDAFEGYLIILKRDYEIFATKEDLTPYDVDQSLDENTRVAVRAKHFECFRISYNKLFSRYGDDLGQYYRTLYTIMKFVHQSALPDDDKPFYIKIIRAQLTTHEATMLAMNALSGYSSRQFNNLIRDYGMLKNANHKDRFMKSLGYRIDRRALGKRKALVSAPTEVATTI